MEIEERVAELERNHIRIEGRVKGLEGIVNAQGEANSTEHGIISVDLKDISEKVSNWSPKWVAFAFGGAGLAIGSLIALLAVTAAMIWR